MWFMAERDGQARQRRRRLDRLHAPVRAGARSATCGAAWPRPRSDKLKAGANGAADAHERQARHRPLLHGARAAGDRRRSSRASRPARRARWNCRPSSSRRTTSPENWWYRDAPGCAATGISCAVRSPAGNPVRRSQAFSGRYGGVDRLLPQFPISLSSSRKTRSNASMWAGGRLASRQRVLELGWGCIGGVGAWRHVGRHELASCGGRRIASGTPAVPRSYNNNI